MGFKKHGNFSNSTAELFISNKVANSSSQTMKSELLPYIQKCFDHL
jgi:hypothetical protein